MSTTIPIHEDTNAIQRVNASVHQGQESTERQLEMCVDIERMTVTCSNVHVVQVGRTSKLINDIEACCNRCRNIKAKPLNEEDERLKKSSTHDDATGVAKLDFAFSTKAINENEDCLSTLPSQQANKAPEVPQHNDSRSKELLDVEYGMPLIRKQGSITGVKCETIMKKLEKLQDDGQFEAHEKYACAILESSFTRDDSDMRATLMIERGMAFYYANDLKKCKQQFNAAIRMGNSLVNRELLEARALSFKGTAYRREKRLNKALQCFQQAELLLSPYESGEDKADLYYNYGNLWLDMYSIKSSNEEGQKKIKDEAQKCFEKSIDFGNRDERVRVRLKTKRLSSLKLAVLYLDSGSKSSWIAQSVVLDKDVEKAKKHLDFVEHQLSDGMPLAPTVQLLMTRSDQHYRQGNLYLAREVAKEAIEIAEKLEKTIRIPMLRKRLELLQMELDKTLRSPNERAITTDNGWSGGCSSSDGSE